MAVNREEVIEYLNDLIETYQRVLKQNLPPNVLPVVKHQFTEIKRSHDRIRDLEQAA